MPVYWLVFRSVTEGRWEDSFEQVERVAGDVLAAGALDEVRRGSGRSWPAGGRCSSPGRSRDASSTGTVT